jgi:16S rRNA (uracil1498-N3)-methyltransferase
MRVPRIFQDSLLSEGSTLELDERAAKHLVQVLRFDVGRDLILFNGLDGEFKASISSIKKRTVTVDVSKYIDVNRESTVNIHLAQCVSKGDRFEFALQKAVELGAKEITPIFSMRSQLKLNHERKDKKLKHWKQIAISACEQSGRTKNITLNEPSSLPDFLEKTLTTKNTKLILHPDTELKMTNIQASGNYTLLIGPEGGFDEQEIELATKKEYQCIRLGKQILRTETAPIAAIAALNMLEQEF